MWSRTSMFQKVPLKSFTIPKIMTTSWRLCMVGKSYHSKADDLLNYTEGVTNNVAHRGSILSGEMLTGHLVGHVRAVLYLSSETSTKFEHKLRLHETETNEWRFGKYDFSSEIFSGIRPSWLKEMTQNHPQKPELKKSQSCRQWGLSLSRIGSLFIMTRYLCWPGDW